MSRGNKGTVKAGENLLAVVEVLYEHDGTRLVDIAEELNLAKSTVHRHLKTLKMMEFVIEENGFLYLSTKFVGIGNYVRYRQPACRLAEPIVDDLADQTQERANFFVEEHGRVVCLQRAIGSRGVLAKTNIGDRFPMHATAAGKAILSELPKDRVEAILGQHGLSSETKNTITEKGDLFEELARIRETNVSYNDEEHVEKLRSIGVPVMDGNGSNVGALTISGPKDRLTGNRYTEEFPSILRGASNELQLKLTHT